MSAKASESLDTTDPLVRSMLDDRVIREKGRPDGETPQQRLCRLASSGVLSLGSLEKARFQEQCARKELTQFYHDEYEQSRE